MDGNRIQHRMAASEVLFRQIAAVRTRIGDEFVGFVQLLADIQHVLRAEAETLAASICSADSENGSGAGSESRLSL